MSDSASLSISTQQRNFELVAVVLTGLGKFLFMDWLNLKLAYILVAILFWSGYVLYQQQKQPGILSYWGLSTVSFFKSFWSLFPIFIGISLLAVCYGQYSGSSVLDLSILAILLLYPIWGIIQQFIIIALVGRNLKDHSKIDLNKSTIIAITAFVFGIVHYPHPLLIIATFLLALVYTHLYLKGYNLLVLGIYHGWLGAVFYYTVLGRHAWNEVFEAVSF